jgi:glycosyltransferase involved in cell wall biosynthesis
VERLDVALLKSWDFADWQVTYGSGWQLPYRMDYLEQSGVRLHWTDKLHDPEWRRSRRASVVRWAETATVPFAQAVLQRRALASSPVTLAMFESEANALALARRVSPGRHSTVLAVMTCWLAELLTSSGSARRAGYRLAYQSVDRVYYLSANQGPVLEERLHIPSERLRYLPFGVDDETFRPTGDLDGGYVLVVGRDSGRDWPTLLDAVAGIDIPVKICCRPRDLAGLRIPAGVEVLGYVDRDVYRSLLGRARVVAIATRPVVYPSGQSVLLEAMAMGRTAVVTQSPALEEYIDAGVNCVAVPHGDATSLRQAIVETAADDDLRSRIGLAARRSVETSFNARKMWATVAADLIALADMPRPRS